MILKKKDRSNEISEMCYVERRESVSKHMERYVSRFLFCSDLLQRLFLKIIYSFFLFTVLLLGAAVYSLAVDRLAAKMHSATSITKRDGYIRFIEIMQETRLEKREHSILH